MAEQVGKQAEAKGGDLLDKLGPAGNWLMGKVKGQYDKLAQQYGPKTAVGILAAGQVLSWAPTAIGAAYGVPVYVPGASIAATALSAALVRVYRKVAAKDVDPDLATVMRLGAELVSQLAREWEAYLGANPPDPELAAQYA